MLSAGDARAREKTDLCHHILGTVVLVTFMSLSALAQSSPASFFLSARFNFARRVGVERRSLRLARGRINVLWQIDVLWHAALLEGPLRGASAASPAER